MNPFTSFFDYGFLKTALLAVLLIMPLFSLLGTMVVNRGMAFFSDALGHSALTGMGIGVLCGLSDPTPAMLLFAVLFALGLNMVRHSRAASTDTIIGVFSSCGVALGLVLLSRGGFAKYQTILIGDILNVTTTDLWVLGGALAAMVVVWFLCFNGFHAVSLSPALARSKGLRVRLYDNLFVVLTAVTVMLSIRIVGLLLINAMLILPAAAARNVARSMRGYHGYALLFGIFAGVVGLFLSYFHAAAAGPMIVLLSAVIFFGTYFIGKSERN